jgi:hypothetical protein
LLSISAACESPHASCGPAQLGHDFRQPARGASTAAALRDFQDVEYGLRANAVNAVVADLAPQPFQPQLPWIEGCLGRRRFHFAVNVSGPTIASQHIAK